MAASGLANLFSRPLNTEGLLNGPPDHIYAIPLYHISHSMKNRLTGLLLAIEEKWPINQPPHLVVVLAETSSITIDSQTAAEAQQHLKELADVVAGQELPYNYHVESLSDLSRQTKRRIGKELTKYCGSMVSGALIITRTAPQ